MEETNNQVCLEQRAHAAIRHSPYLGQRALRCEVREGRMILHGEVSSFFQKQMAQEAIRKVQGITQIENNLEVVGKA